MSPIPDTSNLASYTQYNPARSQSYMFTVGGSRNLSFKLQNASVPGVQLGTTQFATTYADLTIPSNKLTFDQLSLNFLVSEGLDEWIEVFQWMLTLSNDPDQTETAELTILNSHNQPILRFIYKSVWPLTLSDLQYTVVGEETVLICNVVFDFDTFDIEIIGTGVKIVHGE